MRTPLAVGAVEGGDVPMQLGAGAGTADMVSKPGRQGGAVAAPEWIICAWSRAWLMRPHAQ